MLIEKQFDTGSRKINYAEGPASGPPLLLIHGWTCSWRTFLPVLPHFVPHYHVVAMDLPGHGHSDPLPNPADNLPELAADIEPLIKAKFNEPTAVFGHSLGGKISLSAVAQNPALFSALIIGDTGLFPPEPDTEPKPPSQDGDFVAKSIELAQYCLKYAPTLVEFTQQYERLFGLPADETERLQKRHWLQSYHRCSPELIIAMFGAIPEGKVPEKKLNQGTVNPGQALPRVTCPILLIQADPEVGCRLHNSAIERAKKLNPLVSSVRIEGEGHGLGISNWNTTPLVRAITLFIETSR
ncbi:MAG: alpha/beta fold hydrolase [Candidatus Latescibacteria bacterium]|nr:alpha/beta fold hydrolase [Candidatus Latescibacterota bacterium]